MCIHTDTQMLTLIHAYIHTDPHRCTPFRCIPHTRAYRPSSTHQNTCVHLCSHAHSCTYMYKSSHTHDPGHCQPKLSPHLPPACGMVGVSRTSQQKAHCEVMKSRSPLLSPQKCREQTRHVTLLQQLKSSGQNDASTIKGSIISGN